uniref:Uncharacterized protein n=1 Tax=Arundo donax TaxID=35708 RepID=A0A0A8YIH2_ARUDO
MESSGEELEVG